MTFTGEPSNFMEALSEKLEFVTIMLYHGMYG